MRRRPRIKRETYRGAAEALATVEMAKNKVIGDFDEAKTLYQGKEKALTDAEACNDAMVEFNDAKKSYDECLIAKTNADANADANADINDLNTKLKTAKVQYKQKADI